MSQVQHSVMQIAADRNGKGCHMVWSVGTNRPGEQQIEGPADKRDFCEQMKEYVDGIFDPTTAMSDEDRNRFIQEIDRKIHSGEKLTADEMQYLRIHDPYTYAMMARVDAQREALKAQMQNSRSKQEAQKVYIEAVARIGDEDPAAEALRAAFNKVREEVMQSSQYEQLPETDEDAKKLTSPVNQENKTT